jgi:NitT/TauT family transport system permease protein
MSAPQTLRHRFRDLAIAILGIVGAWWLYISVVPVPAFLLPTPQSVGQALWALVRSGDIWGHVGATLSVVLVGLTSGVTLGIVCGALLARFDRLRAWLDGPLLFLQTAPKIALAPLFLIWFGLGMLSKVMLVISLVFFPVLIGTVLGVRSVEPGLRDLARILKLTSWRSFVSIELPHAAADIFAGIRVGGLQAVVGAILAEWLSSKVGLGYLMIMANSTFNAPLLFAAVVLTVGIGMAMYFLVESIEMRVLHWRVSLD